jgi:tetratricopeptide (TPR) repeat protein
VLYRKGQVDEAIACFKKAIEIDPKDALAHNSLGAILCDVKRDYDAAIACFKKAIALDPKHADAHAGLGHALRNKGEVDEAIACFRKAIAVAPNDAMGHIRLGYALERKGQVEEAIACYRKAIEIEPRSARAHDSLGNALRDQGKVEEAIACYHKAIEVDPKYAYTHNDLAWLLATCPDAKRRDPQQAVKWARTAVKLAPKAGGFWNTLGVAHYRAGDWKAAVAALEKSMQLSKGGDAFDFFFLAMAHRKLGNHDVARKRYDQALEWLEKNKLALAKDTTQAEELRRFRSEAEDVLELKKK